MSLEAREGESIKKKGTKEAMFSEYIALCLNSERVV